MPKKAPDSGRERILNIIARRKVNLIVSALLAVLGALLGLAPYFIVYLVAKELFLTEQPDRSQLQSLVFYAVAAILGKVLFKAAANAISHHAAYRILADLRIALADRLSHIPLGRVRARSSGHLKKVLQDDVEQLELGLSHAIPDIAAALAVPVASIIVMFAMSWQVGLAALMIVIFAVALIAWGVSRSAGFAEQESAIRTDLNTRVVSYLRGMRVLRGFIPDQRCHNATDAAILASSEIENRKEARGKWQAVASTALTTNPLLFVLPVGLWCVAHSIITPSTLVFFLLVGTGFTQPLMGLLISLAVLQYQVEAGLKSIADILDEPDLPLPENPQQPNGYQLELRDVGFRYRPDSPEVLADLNLVIPEGSSLALVGPSGGGKSTLLGLLTRFHDATRGAVHLGGVDFRAIDPAELMRQIAYVQQDEYIFADTLLENIRMARPEATDIEVRQAADSARVSQFVDDLPQGWQTVLTPGGGQLSGGQRQRISIARAFLKGAKIVLLDEATAFLDAESEAAISEALRELRTRTTMITVAHRLATITDHDRIAYIADGRIIHCAPHRKLLRECPSYAELWSDYLDAQGWQLNASNESNTANTGTAISGERAASDISATSTSSFSAIAPTAGLTAAAVPNKLAESLGETPRVRGLGKMNPFRQWCALLGTQRHALLRSGLWLIIADGILTSAPLIVIVFALLEVLGGSFSPSTWWRYGLMLFGIFLARWLVGVAVATVWWPQANLSWMQLRRAVLNHLRRIPLGVFDRLDIGRISTLVVSDLPLIDFINLPAKVIVGLVQPLLAAVVLFVFDWQLALAALAGVPVFWLLLWLSDGIEKKVLGHVIQERSRASGDLLEFVQGTAVLRANPDAPQARRYRTTVEELRRRSVAMAVRTSPLTSLASAVLELGFALLIWVVCMHHLDGALSQATALLMLIVSLSLYRPYQELLELSSYRHLQSRIAEQVGALWDIDPLPEGEREKPAQVDNGIQVELREVGFSYHDGPRVLEHASMVARPHCVTALVGPSGSGKSTIANLVARFWDVDDGAVFLAGSDLREYTSAGLASLVTCVYQDVYLFPATVRENLSLGNDVPEEDLLRALKLAQADHFVTEMPGGLDATLDEGGGNLSGGQRQRLSIARALVKNAPVLLLDEAVASVDPRTEVKIQSALSSLVAHRTVIVIAHRLNTVQSSECIVVLNNGGIEATGTHAELLTGSPTYAKLWRAHKHAKSSVGC